MATTNSLGIGTGIDLQSMLASIVAAEKVPITALDTKIAAANTRISLYGTLQSKLDSLKTAADTLQFPSRLSALTATSSDSSVLAANAAYNTSAASYKAIVTRLASAQKSFTTAYAAGTTFGPGTLNFTVSGAPAAAVVLSTAVSLQEVGEQINSAKIGVTATVVTTSTGEQRMVLTGNLTGSSNGFSLTTDFTPSGSQAALEDFDLLTAQEILDGSDTLQRSVAQNAEMTIDGINVTSSTNSFSNIKGLTLTAAKLGESTVTVKNDSSKITAAVQAFVDSYNAAVTVIKTNTGYNATTKTSQAFNGDSAARAVLETLGTTRTTTPDDLASATIKTLGELGISVLQTGLLSLDTTKLNSAINTSSANVLQTLSAYGKSFSTAVSTMQSSTGIVYGRVDSLSDSVKRYKDNQEKLEVRVAMVEKRYRAQFVALDKLISTMKITSSSLEQQLAGLAA
jgi:flagellar hook-associated protein 2